VTDSFRPARLGDVELGTGQPKIIVPLTGSTQAALRNEITALDYDDLDIVEWRVDHFSGVDDRSAVARTLDSIREDLPASVPILFTVRSQPEGGQVVIEQSSYEALLRLATESGHVAAIDVEMFTDLGPLERIVNGAHEVGGSVVMSSHDFTRTPPIEQLIARLDLQQDLGADVVKIAVMPQSADDVLTLLRATSEFTSGRGVRPAITMSMGPLGVVSRLSGETFGSCATFGSVGAASAPGQISARELRAVLSAVHGAQA
jgi:3-dehydroquinate dehydratase-1